MPDTPQVEELFGAACGGHRGALARLLSYVERGGAPAQQVATLAHPNAGSAYTVGLTGAPGAGKSTLTNSLCGVLRGHGDRVGILAIDPSSPFSGGAILGDRVRMGDQALDEGVIIRSMATRGHLGGLSLATPAAIRLLDAVGFPWVLVETVGVGQVEVEIVGAADTCVVVVNPGWGDAVQANKAGLMEIADIFVVNKADRAGAANTVQDLEQMLALKHADGWEPPVVCTVATEAKGVGEVADAISRHREWLEESGEFEQRRQRRATAELRGIIAALLAERASLLAGSAAFETALSAVVSRSQDPWSAAHQILGT